MAGPSHSPRFPEIRLPEELVADLRRSNPWWEHRPPPATPATRRHLVERIQRRAAHRLAPITVVRGPRQVGKTTAQLQVIADRLEAGTPGRHVLRVQADRLSGLDALAEPLLRIVDWFEQEILQASLNEVAHSGGSTLLVFDEVQNLPGWSDQLKFLVDHATTQVLVTGSSALRIERGRDSLAGRISTLEAGVLSLTEIGAFRGLDLGPPALEDNGLEPLTRMEFWQELVQRGRSCAPARDAAFEAFSGRGGYPFAHSGEDVPWGLLAQQLNETVIQRVLLHDVEAEAGDAPLHRDALEVIFDVACRYAGMAPAPDVFGREVQRATGRPMSRAQVRRHLRALEDTLLVRWVEPIEMRRRRTTGHGKICLADHALRAAWLQELLPLTPEGLMAEPDLHPVVGPLAEGVCGAMLSTLPQLGLAWKPGRIGEPEVDFVLTVGSRRIPVEVKYQRRLDWLRDTDGLRGFIETRENNAPFGLLVSLLDEEALHDPRIVVLPLSTLLLLR